ncbi:hypothetical protein COCOR_00097 [Corallococcus coralloides DSM 2259]|uniref:Uncharacterized protein n=1 Tax=Corallococcus coralloides (strain ATCC 25202 / DSM 2259 / NBRC 100086 / M2) TaxID=1144275 RepID=H8MTJ1_CORCM|nr:hypothetical protein [Corallococcus coralloides]AFE03270.1 hypothetical protein COCOR_00097 [Corallococcus coralloides DSM 2259]
MSLRKDFIERAIEQFVAAIASILKARKEKRYGDARALIRDTSLTVLGMEYGALVLADAESTSRLLGTAARVRMLAKLVREDGELMREQGDPLTADSRFLLSLELYLEAISLGLNPDTEDATAIAELRTLTDTTTLSERHQRMLSQA